MVADTQQSSAHAAHFTSAVYTGWNETVRPGADGAKFQQSERPEP